VIKRLLAILLLIVVVLGGILITRAFALASRQLPATPAPPLTIDRTLALQRFSRAIQFRTISFEEQNQPTDHAAFIAWVAQAYPRVHASLQREVVGRSLLYTWRGSDPSLAPQLLMGHYDVVPVEPGTESRWEQPPFSGAVANGYVWGRGTLDDKVTVIAILEAAESLLAEGWRPRRTLLFSFGEDEELGGSRGAARIAKLLAARGVKLDAVLDEGGAIMTGAIEGTTKPVALIGIAEKGLASIELSASGKGGHSSMPPPRTEVGAIAAAVDRVQNAPFRAGVRGAAAEMFRWLAPEVAFGPRIVLANLWLFEPLLALQAKESHSINAMLRTTIAPTIIGGGVKDNVIPAYARAVINFRTLPGDTIADVVAHVRRAIDDPHTRVRLFGEAWEPSPVADPSAPQFQRVQRAVRAVDPDALVAPYLLMGATDSRHFEPLTRNVYRFVPLPLREPDLDRIHGTNERVAVSGYFDAIRFYRQLMRAQ